MSEAEQHTTEKIQVFLLGPAEIRYQGGLIHIERRLARSLFYYLAAHHGPISREELLRIFWHEGDDSQIRARLSENLWRIRARLPNPTILSSDNEMVWLDRAQVYVDLEHFSRLRLTLGNLPWQIPPDQPLPFGVYEQMDTAVRLWRAPEFLSGVKLTSTPVLDEWLVNTTQRLEIARFRLLRRLAQHAYASSDIQLTCDYATAALEYEPLDVELIHAYITCLLSAGMHSDARQVYNKFRLTYRKEFKTEPPAEFTALRNQLQQKEDIQKNGVGEWQIHTSLETPFIGRAPVLKKLNARLQQGGVLFLLGDSGQGKTRLLKELWQENLEGMRLLYVNCRPTNNQTPLQPLIEILSRYVQPTEWQRLPTLWQSCLSWMLPELLEQFPGWQPPVELQSNQAQAYLQTAVQKVFELLAQGNRIVLVIDDAQWTDESSLKMLSHLMGQPPFTTSSTLILSGRSEEKKAFADVWLPIWRGLPKFEEIMLTGLDTGEILDLLRAATGMTPSENHTQQIAAATAGNPFFILEIVRSLSGQIRPDSQGTSSPLPLPASVHSLIQYRIGRLTAPAKGYIQAAAVLGSPFNTRQVQLMQGLGDEEAAAVLMELQDYQMVQPVPEQANFQVYQFSHDKLTESILTAMPAGHQSLLHKKAAQMLESAHAIDLDRQAVLLAKHWQSGGEPEKAFEYWLRAAENARHLFSLEQAEGAFQQAERLSQTSGIPFRDEQLYKLYASWSEMIFERDNPQALQQLNEHLLELGRSRRSDLLIGVALDGLSDVKMASNEYQEGLTLVNEALPYLKNSENIFEYSEALMHRGVFLYMLGNIAAALPVLQSALDLLLENDDPQAQRALPNARYQLGIALSLGGQPQTALQHARECVRLAKLLRRPYIEILGYSLQAFCEFTLGSYHASHESCRVGIELAEKVSGWRILGYLHGYQAMSAIALGQIHSARSAIQKTIEIGSRFDHSDLQALGYRLAGDLAVSLGSSQTAIPMYQNSLQYAGRTFLAPDALFRLGFAQCLSGEIEQGLPLIERALQILRENGLGIIELIAEYSYLFVTGIQQRQPGNYKRVLAHARRCLESGVREIAAISYFCAAVLSMDKGEYAEADENLAEGLQLAHEIRHVWIELRLLNHLRRRLHAPAVAVTNSYLVSIDVQHRMYELYEQLRRQIVSEGDIQIIEEYRRLYNIFPA